MEKNKMTDEELQKEGLNAAECKSSSPYTKRTREEGRKMIARYEEIGRLYMEYITEHNMLPKPCPARKWEADDETNK